MTALDFSAAADSMVRVGITGLGVALLLTMLVALIPAWLRLRREERLAEERARMLETEFPDIRWTHRRAS